MNEYKQMARQQKIAAEVIISTFTKKGHGLGKTTDPTNRIVEVPFTIPGDKVQAILQRKRSGTFKSVLEEIITPSPLRIQPRCLHFSKCGGCRWQQMAYDTQLEIKQKTVEKLFAPLRDQNTLFHPIASCVDPWNYRNKMEFSFSGDSKGNRYLGLIMDGSQGKVINLTECHLVNPWFIEALEAVRHWWENTQLKAYHPNSDTGSLRTLTVREGIHTGDRLVMLTVSGNPEFALHRHQLDKFVASLRESIEWNQSPDTQSRLSIFLRIQQAIKGQPTSFYEILLHGPDHIREILEVKATETKLELMVSPSAFFQPNTKQAEQLYTLALNLLDIPPNSVVYDLYCGTGTLGLSIAKKAKLVVGIEISEESSLDGRTNAKNNGLSHVHILTGSVRDVIEKIRKENTFPMPDVVIVDPPRAGLDPETLQHLAELLPRKILYISCNPVTQADNVKALQQMGYRLAALQPVDQFPHTPHIENIAILVL